MSRRSGVLLAILAFALPSLGVACDVEKYDDGGDLDETGGEASDTGEVEGDLGVCAEAVTFCEPGSLSFVDGQPVCSPSGSPTRLQVARASAESQELLGAAYYVLRLGPDLESVRRSTLEYFDSRGNLLGREKVTRRGGRMRHRVVVGDVLVQDLITSDRGVRECEDQGPSVFFAKGVILGTPIDFGENSTFEDYKERGLMLEEVSAEQAEAYNFVQAARSDFPGSWFENDLRPGVAGPGTFGLCFAACIGFCVAEGIPTPMCQTPCARICARTLVNPINSGNL